MYLSVNSNKAPVCMYLQSPLIFKLLVFNTNTNIHTTIINNNNNNDNDRAYM